MVLNKNQKNFKKGNLIILNIISNSFSNKYNKNQNYTLIKKNENFYNLIKNKKEIKKYLYLVIEFKNFNLFKIILLFFVMMNNLKINKNFFIFFKLKKECIGYNFFPDWPNKYLNLTLFESFTFWLKKFLYIFLNLKKIKYIIIKKK